MKFVEANLFNTSSIPDMAGNYIVCLRNNSQLPFGEHDVQFKMFKGHRILYTGISNRSLRKRDVNSHFYGHAGKSTLRKSIGSLFGFTKIPRDKNDPTNGKTKFDEKGERILTEWMQKNLILFYKTDHTPSDYEDELILEYNPPLNLMKNRNGVNKVFRQYLSCMRKINSTS